jgi:oxepin-CoA hydrolase / 3-oxo-5,6-dehydrosuberyl-CoA semialdehyde dehydrogenase
MAITHLENYAEGKWVKGQGDGQTLFDASTGEALYSASSRGLDFGAMMHYGRTKGREKLAKMGFHDRGLMLKKLALHLQSKKRDFYAISFQTGATKVDSWIDIEGGIGNLFTYASLRRQFPNEPFYLEGQMANLSKEGTFIGHHIMTPKEGVAIHINAFNFPVWGMLEKIAVNLLAGVPAIVKPATITSYLTEAVAKEIIASGILPEGSLQLICGSARGILDHVILGDTVTFTGSCGTGKMLEATPRLKEEGVHFTMEADSLNCCVLGKDVTPDMPEFDIFIKEVAREITVKAGQKCTAIRRIMVPEAQVENVKNALGARLEKNIIGNPSNENTRMGPLAGTDQRADVLAAVEQLQAENELMIGNLNENFEVLDGDAIKGAFLKPMVFFNDAPYKKMACHNVEAFGPISTVMPYKDLDDAIALAKLGKGSLVGSIITADNSIAKDFLMGSASTHGRILILNKDCAKESTGHGSPMPMLTHGGPGRAGGGEEMGGVRGVAHYMDRTAIQGSPTTIMAISNQYQMGAQGTITEQHPFTKHYEELNIGDQLISKERLITDDDIDKFAELSGDHFYAHKRDTDFTDTMFDEQVAHGYFIMSAAAGLFVDPIEKNPVLLNYGIDELRFTKPVYPGAKIHIKFTCKEKIPTELKPEDEDPKNRLPKGIVKWMVEMYDDSDEPLVGVATILTMVKLKG